MIRCHPVGRIDLVGERAEGGLQLPVDGAAPDDQVADLREPFPFGRDLERVIDLKRDHGREVQIPVEWLGEWMAGGLADQQFESPLERTDDDHLARYIA